MQGVWTMKQHGSLESGSCPCLLFIPSLNSLMKENLPKKINVTPISNSSEPIRALVQPNKLLWQKMNKILFVVTVTGLFDIFYTSKCQCAFLYASLLHTDTERWNSNIYFGSLLIQIHFFGRSYQSWTVSCRHVVLRP